jgi:hypothetical protein
MIPVFDLAESGEEPVLSRQYVRSRFSQGNAYEIRWKHVVDLPNCSSIWAVGLRSTASKCCWGYILNCRTDVERDSEPSRTSDYSFRQACSALIYCSWYAKYLKINLMKGLQASSIHPSERVVTQTHALTTRRNGDLSLAVSPSVVCVRDEMRPRAEIG